MEMASMVIDGQEFMQTADAAEELGVTVEAVNKAVQRGGLKPCRKLGNYNLFHRDEVERYRAESLGKRGRRKEKVA
jgi:excisionase family DNA binding protein